MTQPLVSSFPVSRERFSVLYRLDGDEKTGYERARDICLEQTVEIPETLVPDGVIRDHGQDDRAPDCEESAPALFAVNRQPAQRKEAQALTTK